MLGGGPLCHCLFMSCFRVSWDRGFDFQLELRSHVALKRCKFSLTVNPFGRGCPVKCVAKTLFDFATGPELLFFCNVLACHVEC